MKLQINYSGQEVHMEYIQRITFVEDGAIRIEFEDFDLFLRGLRVFEGMKVSCRIDTQYFYMHIPVRQPNLMFRIID